MEKIYPQLILKIRCSTKCPKIPEMFAIYRQPQTVETQKLRCDVIARFILLLSTFEKFGTQSNAAPLMLSSSLPVSNRMRKKMLKKTSYQKTREEFERIKEKQRKKKEVNCFLC